LKIGMMNSPAFPLRQEIKFASANKFDFIDLTLEPPGASPWQIVPEKLMRLLDAEKIGAMGHTAYYLPLDSPFPAVKTAVQAEMTSQCQLFARIGVTKVTIHFGFSFPHRFFPYKEKRKIWLEALQPVAETCEKLGVQLLLENTQNTEECHKLLTEILLEYPTLGFHLDVGHANLNTRRNKTGWLLEKLASRLCHVHLSDNIGGSDDLHLPIGAGFVPWKNVISLIKKTGYNDTITLEVFSRNRQYLVMSREILRNLWE
jgi:sugar phosphate isomerase/epimerase